ncbi:MAG: GNAT family N-acetyltransferase [Chitinophagaceae bacterium]
MTKETFILRPMELGDIESGMRLSKAEGWNQTGKDWRVFLENPENVCLAAELNNKIIGTTTAINYSNEVAWIGMVLVDKEYRGLGISKSLLTNVFKKLDSCRSIKLDATPAGQQVYKKLDFADEYLVARMTNTSVKNLSPADDSDAIIEQAQVKHIPEIIALDEFVFGANRGRLIEYLIKDYPDKAWILKRDNSITGFALGREGNKYHQVGPVMASNMNDAKMLITKSMQKHTNQSVVVDVLCDKENLINWLESIGFTKQRDFMRMYKKENPFPGTIGQQFLISGPEFG